MGEEATDILGRLRASAKVGSEEQTAPAIIRAAIAATPEEARANIMKVLEDDPKLKIDRKDSKGYNALMYLTEAGDLENVKFLVQKGASIKSKDDMGQAVFVKACQSGHVEIAQFFLDDLVKKEDQKRKGRRDVAKVKEEINREITQYINVRDDEGVNALMFATEKGMANVTIIEFLLGKATELGNASSMLHAKDDEGWNVGFWASWAGHLDLLKYYETEWQFFLDEASLNEKAESPLMKAAGNGHVDVCKFLLEEKQVKVGHVDVNGQNALMWAAACGQVEAVKLLLEAQANVAAKQKNAKTALHLAAHFGQIEVCQILLKADVSEGDKKVIAEIDEEKESVVFGAIRYGGFPELVDLFLDEEPSLLNMHNKKGLTPLMLAAHQQEYEVCEQLLKRPGIDLLKEDQNNLTAMDHAEGRVDFDIVKLLREPTIAAQKAQQAAAANSAQ